jgi:hypothetical protein
VCLALAPALLKYKKQGAGLIGGKRALLLQPANSIEIELRGVITVNSVKRSDPILQPKTRRKESGTDLIAT